MYQQFPDPSIVDKSFQEHFDIPNKTMYDIVHDMALLRPSEEALSFLNARMSFRALDRAIDDCAKGRCRCHLPAEHPRNGCFILCREPLRRCL